MEAPIELNILILIHVINETPMIWSGFRDQQIETIRFPQSFQDDRQLLDIYLTSRQYVVKVDFRINTPMAIDIPLVEVLL
jgi:hypothetical protein